MKRVSNAYKMAMAKYIRNHFYMVVSVGVISNEAQHSAKVTSDNLYLSDNKFLFKTDEVKNEYATFEENQALADGSQIFPPENDEVIQLASDIACISKDILGSITVQFDNAYDIKGLTLNFGKNYPTEFNVIINGSETHNYTNDKSEFITEDNFNSVRTITIQAVHFNNGDNKRLRIETMLMGVGIVFDNSKIETAKLQDRTSFVCEELPQIDFVVTCFDVDKKFNVDDSNSFINYLESGQAINTTIGVELDDGSIEWVEMPITYITEWASDTQRVTFTTADRIALFTEKYSDGNYIHERTLYDDAIAVRDFLGLEADEFLIDDVLKNITVTNPLPAVAAGECLQLIANAGRCSLRQDSFGRVTFIPNFENIIDPEDIIVNTDSQADWSKPSNIRTGSSVVYADFTRNFASADGSMYFLPESATDYLETGYVSREMGDIDGLFTTNPTVSLVLPAAFTYFGIHLEFAGNPPQEFKINTYKSSELQDSVTVTNPDLDCYVNQSFYNFDKIELEFTKSYPKNRIVLQKVSFGNLTDYRLVKRDMLQNPIGVVEPKTKSVSVKIFTYEEDEKGKAKKVDDDNFYTVDLNPIGEVVTFENQLISTEEHAQQIAEWLANYYANNVTYTVNYRGEPRIESLDYIFMDSDILNNLQVEVESHILNFNGALSGTLELRRAINMINA